MPPATARSPRLPRWTFWPLLAVGLAAVFGPMSLLRLVDADEGIYLVNTRAVMQGEVPYLDFFYPQMFLLPYVYGAWMAVTGVSWYAGRLLSAVFAVALGLLVAREAERITGERRWAVLAALLVGSSTLAIAWYTVVKTYALATLLLFAACAVLSADRSRRAVFLGGLLAGLAVDVRLYLVVVIPVLALEVVRRERGTGRLRAQLAHLGAGLLVAFLPAALFLALDPGLLLFNVVGVHGVRSPAGFVGDLPQKVATFFDMLGVTGTYGPTSFQFAILVAMTAAALVALARRREPVPLALLVALVLVAVSLVPTPTYAQYFCMAVPFLVVEIVRFTARAARNDAERAFTPLFAVLLAAHVLVAPADVYRYAVRGDNVPGVHAPGHWRIPAIRAVSRAIDDAAPGPGAVALSWWPGYFVEARTPLLSRMENPYGLWYSYALTFDQILRYKFMSHPEIAFHLHQHTVPVVVIGNMMFDTAPMYRDVLRRTGYEMIRTVSGAEIYRWPGAATRTAAPAGGTR
jgi:hypothetical protein